MTEDGVFSTRIGRSNPRKGPAGQVSLGDEQKKMIQQGPRGVRLDNIQRMVSRINGRKVMYSALLQGYYRE
jgi:hypothetical protein